MKNFICPSCSQVSSFNPLYTRKHWPVLINVAYDSFNQARSCITGTVELVQCNKCGFVFNTNFDENLIAYDNYYDNSRDHSTVYCDYLDYLVSLCSSWLKDDMIVLEIGCGKGDFLKKLSDLTGCQADGYDLTYEGKQKYKDRVSFYKSYFQAGTSNKKYDLLILRHVLEHVAKPYDFMSELFEKIPLQDGARLLIEVPDFKWILKKCSFFDISYEHCNYFLNSSLKSLMAKLGVTVERISNVFGDEYLFLQGILEKRKKDQDSLPLTFPLISQVLFEKFIEAKEKIIENIKQADNACIWGAAGKGTIFLSDLPDAILDKISYVVDINPLKQGKYLPLSGKKVASPETLKQVKGKLLVVIMNKIYEQEIHCMLDKLGVKVSKVVSL